MYGTEPKAHFEAAFRELLACLTSERPAAPPAPRSKAPVAAAAAADCASQSPWTRASQSSGLGKDSVYELRRGTISPAGRQLIMMKLDLQ